MAVINKLRNSGWVVIIIMVALAVFVLTDFISGLQKGGAKGVDIGEMDGRSISFAEFDEAFKAKENQYLKSYGTNTLDDNTKEMLLEQTWNDYLRKIVVEPEYEKLGLIVSSKELEKNFFTNDAHALIKQYFTDKDGGFNPETVRAWFKQVYASSPDAKEFGNSIKEAIVSQIVSDKYSTMISKSIYATSVDAELNFLEGTQVAKGKLIQLNYYTIPDTAVSYTDADLEAYLLANKHEFTQIEARDLEFVSWNIYPSADDTLAAKNWANAEVANFRTAEDDSLYVTLNSELPFDKTFKPRGSFSAAIEDSIFNLNKGEVTSAIYYDGGYSVFKVVDTEEDSVDYYRTSQILLTTNGTTKADTAATMAEAKAIIAKVKAGADFVTIAKEKNAMTYLRGTDGDMGWWRADRQIADVAKAVKNLNKGDMAVVKTAMGISIVRVTANKSRKKVMVGEVRKKIEPMKTSIKLVSNQVNKFRSTLTDGKDGAFEKAVVKANLNLMLADNVGEKDKAIPGIVEAKEVVRWAFDPERKEGDISPIFTPGNKQVIVHLKTLKKKDELKVSYFEEDLKKKVIKAKKAELLIKKMNDAMEGKKSMEEIAIALKTVAQPIDGQTLMSDNVQFAGNDKVLAGIIMGITPGKMSIPIEGEEGVYLIMTEKPENVDLPNDIDLRKTYVFNDFVSRAESLAVEILQKKANISDYRLRYY